MPFAKNSVEIVASSKTETAAEALDWALGVIDHILGQTPAEDASGREKAALAEIQQEMQFLRDNHQSVSAFALRGHVAWLTDPVVRKVSKMAGKITIPVKVLASKGVTLRFFEAGKDKPEPAVDSVYLAGFAGDGADWLSLDAVIADAVRWGHVDVEGEELVPLLVRRKG